MITSIFLRALCGYVWVNILTLSPRGVNFCLNFLVSDELSRKKNSDPGCELIL